MLKNHKEIKENPKNISEKICNFKIYSDNFNKKKFRHFMLFFNDREAL